MKLDFTPHAVVFDMDGLLFDTETLHHEAIQAAAEAMGRVFPTALFHRMLGQPWPTNHALLLAEWGDAAQIDELRLGWYRQFDHLAATRLSLKPGAIELLTLLAELGIPRAIATSSARETATAYLAAHGLTGSFNTIVARGDYAVGKPAPDPFLLAADRLGVEPRSCLALEDSHAGVRSAAAAGMVTVMVPDLVEPTHEIRSLCLAVAPDLLAVRHALEPR